MKIEELKNNFIKKLSTIMPKNEAKSEFNFILKEQFNLTEKDLILSPQKLEKHIFEIENIIKTRLETRKPLQYILNKAVFADDIYFVDENVLIPRPETELLVREAAKYLNSNSKILEIGTGSGCISILLAKLLKNNNITSCDISNAAIEIAQKNAKSISPEQKIKFLVSDLYENINEKFDAIISNPPYIPYADAETLELEVLNHEPHSALFAKNDGMYFYEQIIKNSKKYLNVGGFVALEAGINQAQKLKNLFINNTFAKIIIVPDLSSIDRIVIAW